MPEPGPVIYRVGGLEISPHQGCVRRNGEEIPLRARSFRVLVYLVEHRDRLVTKDELITALWSGVAVTDDVLVQCVKDVRRALGDDTRSPRYIKTVLRAGYRFIGEVAVANAEGEDRFPADTEAAGSPAPAPSHEPTVRDIARPARPGQRSGSWRARVSVWRVAFAAAALLLGILSARVALRPAPEPGAIDTVLPSVPGRRTVLVMPFENTARNAERAWLSDGLADMLIAGLGRSARLTVLSRQQLHVLLDRRSSSPGARALEDAIAIARQARAEVVVLGGFTAISGRLRVDLQVHDQRGALMATDSLTVESDDRVLAEVDLLAARLQGRLSGGPATDAGGVSTVMTDDIDAFRYYSLALRELHQFRPVDAIALLEKAIQLDPDFAMAHARIGYAYAVTWGQPARGKPYLERAFRHPERLTELDRLSIVAWRALADLDYDAAMEAYRRMIARFPAETESYLRLGMLLVGDERMAEAREVLHKGIALDPGWGALYNAMVVASARIEDRIAMAKRYAAVSPAEPNAHDTLGLSYLLNGSYEQAIAAFRRALQLDPDFEVAIVHLGNAHAHVGQYREAERLFERYVQIAPSPMERMRGLGLLARLQARRGDIARATGLFRKQVRAWGAETIPPRELADGDAALKAIRLRELKRKPAVVLRGQQPPRRMSHYYEGEAARLEGRPADALAGYARAIRYAPIPWDLEDLEDCLAVGLMEAGRWREAIAEYQRILAVNQRYPRAHFRIAAAHEQLGERDAARTAYRRFLEVWKDADADLPEVVQAKRRLGVLDPPRRAT